MNVVPSHRPKRKEFSSMQLQVKALQNTTLLQMEIVAYLAGISIIQTRKLTSLR